MSYKKIKNMTAAILLGCAVLSQSCTSWLDITPEAREVRYFEVSVCVCVCKRHLIHNAGCTEQSGEAGRKEAERRQHWPGACPGPGWVNYATGSRRFGSKGEK